MLEGVISDVLLGSLGSLGSSNIIPPLTQQTLSEMISLWYTLQFTQHWKKKGEKLNWLFIYFDDYRPLICASDWLLQTTHQIRRSVYFSDLRGNSHFFNVWIVRNYSFTQLLSVCLVLSSRRTRVSGLWVFWFFFLKLFFLPCSSTLP